MGAFFAAVRRIVRRDGEAVLERAVAGLETAKTRLYAAAGSIDDEKEREIIALSDERVKFRQREARYNARIASLRASFERAVRVAGKIADLVE